MNKLTRAAPLLALVTFVVLAASFQLRSTDVFWHLAAGRWILEHGQLPSTDPFRFTSGTLSWIDHEWLFQVLIRGVEIAGGVPGLVVMRTGLALCLAFVLYRGVSRIGATQPEAILLTLLAILGARPRLMVRPEIFTLIFLAVLLDLLRRYAIDGGRRWSLMMSVLVVIWANLHGEAILAPVVAGLYLLGAALRPATADMGDRGRWARPFALPAILGLCLLLNPYGWHIFAVGFGITGAMRNLAAYNPEWVPLWIAPQPFLFAGLLLMAVMVAITYRRTRQVHLPTLLVTLALGAVSISAVRHQALFFIAAPYLAAETLAAGWRLKRPLLRVRQERLSPLATIACLLSLAWCLSPPSWGPLRPHQGRFVPGLSIESGRFPEQAADFLARNPEVGPLFNTFAHGGYLLWRLYPPRQVFHDGRMELQPDLLREIGQARSNNRDWNELLKSYGAAGALVRYDERPRPVMQPDPETGQLEPAGHRTTNSLLFPSHGYALVYWDDLVMLFLDKSQPQPPGLLAREFVFVQPEDLAWTLERAAIDGNFRQQCLREVRRKLLEDPASKRARLLLDELSELL